jgi:hypothetical protein
MPMALMNDRAARAGDDALRIERKYEELQQAMTIALNAVAELELIAPAEVIRPADQAYRLYNAYRDRTSEGATLAGAWPIDIEMSVAQLSAAMRADLGEEPLAADTEPAGPAETDGPEPASAPA